MTHTKKLTIFFLAFTTLFTFLLWKAFGTQTSFGNRFRDFSSNQTFQTDELSSKLLRFRVLAASDSSQDQLDKKQLCAKLIPLLSSELSNVQTKEEAVTLVRESLPFLTAYCEDVLSSTQSVSCTLGPHLFPYKTYGSFQFPAGIYDTLLVTIGSGSGSNWWCLAFPPLCFADEAFVDMPTSSKDLLFDVLGEDLYDEICTETKSNTHRFFKIFSSCFSM